MLWETKDTFTASRLHIPLVSSRAHRVLNDAAVFCRLCTRRIIWGINLLLLIWDTTNKHKDSVEREQVNILPNGIQIYNQQHKNIEMISLDIILRDLCLCLSARPDSLSALWSGRLPLGVMRSWFYLSCQNQHPRWSNSGRVNSAGLPARPHARWNRWLTAALHLLPLSRLAKKPRCAGGR